VKETYGDCITRVVRDVSAADVALLFGGTHAAAEGETPIEFGRVAWLADFDRAAACSKETGKPILLLFQEVPGCSTCQRFGAGPLSHPLLVDASREFIPLAIRNNVKGQQRTILERFGEPAWNNPVVRFVDSAGADVIPRKAGVYSTGELLGRMLAALEAAERPAPKYLELVAFEYAPQQQQWATFAMHCYWVGEQRLGRLPGVLATRIGMLRRQEVVDVKFDPTVIAFADLLAKAEELQCARTVFARSDGQQAAARQRGGLTVVRTDEPTDTSTTQQYHLARHKAYHLLPLTALQATKVNAALAAGEDPDPWLSPSQLEMKQRIDAQISKQPKALSRLTPDRSPASLVGYNHQLETALRQPED